jgi:ArsR family transcriptional regulator
MKLSKYELFEIHADFCKTIANPKRLLIVNTLKDKEMTVSQFAELLDLPIANISQHLKALRDHDIVSTRKEGQKVYYSLNNPRLLDACEIISEIILDLNKQKGKIIRQDLREFKVTAHAK